MNVQRKVTQSAKLVSGGRLQVPVDLRRELGIADGDTVVMEVKDGSLVITPYRQVIARVQEMLRPYRPTDGTLVSEELIAERRAEAERE